MAISRRNYAGQIVIGLMVVTIVVLLIWSIYDPCPEGFVRECGQVIFGKLIGHNCECVPA
jgi:uncharacterized membrane protein AbrB (regulator of aidB expression)